ncbi:MAG: hypothetical protein OXG85_06040 [Chloroflexi bacterium]|nr:hypothetical protein [Chloroflexota bacterium]
MERFTQRARRVLGLAQEAAISLQSASIDTEHLLLGLMSEEDSIAARILSAAGIDGSQVEDLARAESKAKPALAGQIDLSADSKATLELAVDEARRQGHNYIGSEHLLLGLLRLEDGAALNILRKLDVSPDQIRRQYTTLMREQPAATARSEAPGPSRRVFSSNIEYFLLRSTSRSSGQISHLPVELSIEVKDALEEALKEIAHTGFLRLEERHLLLGLLQNREGAVRRILLDTGIDPDEIIHKLRRPIDG